MIFYLLMVILLGKQLFFAVGNTLGLTYHGREESSVYIIFMVILAIFSLFVFFIDRYKNHWKITKKEIIALTIPLVISSIFLLEYLIGNISPRGIVAFRNYVIFVIPAILVAVVVAREQNILKFIKPLHIGSLILTISSLHLLFDTLISGTRASIGGATYQAAGYIIALAYGLQLLFMLKINSEYKLAFTNASWFKGLSFLIVPALIFAVIVTGARGPMVVVVIFTLYYLISSIKTITTFFKTISLLLMGSLIIYLSWDAFMAYDNFQSAWNRTFAYIGESGIDWGGTSGRDRVYTNALALFNQSPAYGYGIFGYFRFAGYPHNLFLELMLQGGILLIVPSVFFLFNKGFQWIKFGITSPLFSVPIVFFIHSLMHLQFSGTYLSNGFLWFSLVYLYLIKNNNTKRGI